jgi:hypothetical protein
MALALPGCSAILGIEELGGGGGRPDAATPIDASTPIDARPAPDADPGDITPPRVTETLPVNGATEIAVDAPIAISFSEDLDAFTVSPSTITLEGPDGPVDGTVAYQDRTITFTPTVRLPGGTFFTVHVSAVVTDVAGNAIGLEYSFNFSTGFAPSDFNAVIEYTLRDSPPDGLADFFVGGNPPAVFLDIKPTTEDRAVVEFDLALIPESFQSATLEYEMSTLDPGGSSGRVEIYLFDANGLPDFGDFQPGTLFAEFFGPDTTDFVPASWDVANFLSNAKTRGETHIGFLFLAAEGTDRFRLATSNDSPARAPRLRVVY